MKINIDKTMEDCRKLCNHILKLSKINNPVQWKKFGKPHISIWVDLKNKKYDTFCVAFPDGVWNETVVHFQSSDAGMNVKQFKESKKSPFLNKKKNK